MPVGMRCLMSNGGVMRHASFAFENKVFCEMGDTSVCLRMTEGRLLGKSTGGVEV